MTDAGDWNDSCESADSQPPTPSGPIEVRPDCSMVGYRNPTALLQCNTYLRTFQGGGPPIHVCVDPGSRIDFPHVQRNICELIEDLEEVHSFTLNHQDPDVVGNSAALCEYNPNIGAVMSEEVWRLVQHLDIRPRRLHFANAARSKWMTIADRFRWQVVPTPFCHFRGAMAFYDPELRTLFSGDLFGGFNRLGLVRLEAQEDDWPGIAQFHQIYMPTREALRYAVRQIQSLQPAVEVIAPQHGFVISGDLVPLFLERLHELLVGLDLVAVELDESYLAGYREALSRLAATAEELFGKEEVLRRLLSTDRRDGFDRLVSVRADEIALRQEGYSAITLAFERLAQGEPPEVANQLRAEILQACADNDLPIPPIGAGLAEGVSMGHVGSDGIRME